MNPNDKATTPTIEKPPQQQLAEQDPTQAGTQQKPTKVERFDPTGTNAEAHETDHEALRVATNLDNLPATGASATAAHNASIQAESGEGAFRTRIVSIDTGDKVLTGGLAGTQLVTPTGEKYSVQPNDQSGTYQVQKLGPNGETTGSSQEGKLSLLTNAFSLDGPQPTPKFQPNSSSGETTTPAEQVAPQKPAVTGTGSAASMDGSTFYNQYKTAQTPEERQQLASYYNTLNPDQQTQFRNEVQAAAQKDDRSTAINTITNLRQDVRATANTGEGGSAERAVTQTAGSDGQTGSGRNANQPVGQPSEAPHPNPTNQPPGSGGAQSEAAAVQPKTQPQASGNPSGQPVEAPAVQHQHQPQTPGTGSGQPVEAAAVQPKNQQTPGTPSGQPVEAPTVQHQHQPQTPGTPSGQPAEAAAVQPKNQPQTPGTPSAQPVEAAAVQPKNQPQTPGTPSGQPVEAATVQPRNQPQTPGTPSGQPVEAAPVQPRNQPQTPGTPLVQPAEAAAVQPKTQPQTPGTPSGQPVEAAVQPKHQPQTPGTPSGQPAEAAAVQPKNQPQTPGTPSGQPVEAAPVQPRNQPQTPGTPLGQPVEAAAVQPKTQPQTPGTLAGQPVEAAPVQPRNQPQTPGTLSGQPVEAAAVQPKHQPQTPGTPSGQPAEAAAVQPKIQPQVPGSGSGQPIESAAAQPRNLPQVPGQPIESAAVQPKNQPQPGAQPIEAGSLQPKVQPQLASQSADRVVNAPPTNIDKVQQQPAQTVVADHSNFKPPVAGSDKTVGAVTTPGGIGSDKTGGTSTTGAPPNSEIRPLNTGATGSQIPGTDVRLVQLKQESNDARVQQIVTGGQGDNKAVSQVLPGTQAKDGALQPHGRDVAQAGLPGKDVAMPGAQHALGKDAAQRVEATAANEQKLADGRQLPPALASKVMDAAGKGQLPSEIMARAADAAGKIQQQAVDGAIKHTQEAAHGDSAVKGSVAKVGDAATVGRGTADGASLVQAQRTGIPGFDMKNPQDRQFLSDTIKQLQASNVKEFHPNTQNLSDVLKGMDPARIDKLQAFFLQNSDATKGDALSLNNMVSRLGLALADSRDGMQLPAANRLTDLLTGPQQSNLLGGKYLTDLTKTLGDLNQQLGIETVKGISILDLTRKSLTPSEGQDTHATEAFTARLTPTQEALIRTLLTGAKPDGKADATLAGKPEAGKDATHPDSVAGRTTDAAAAALAAMTAKAKEDATKQGANLQDDRDKDKDAGKAKDDKTKKEDEKEELMDADKRAALQALLAAQKLKEQKENDLKEKEQTTEKDKKKDEEGKRTQYVVKEKDTLQSIAMRQLRDVRLAPLIYEINKSTIAITKQRGRDVFVLRAGQIIWLPSTLEARAFRSKLASAAIAQQQPSQPGQQAMTPEQELAARFGANWSGDQATAGDAQTTSAQSALLADAVAKDRKRRQNIERVLGPFSDKKPSSEISPLAGGSSRIRGIGRVLSEIAHSQSEVPTGPAPEPTEADLARRENIERLLGPLTDKKPEDETHTRYVARLGDTLKSIATKHPSLQDVALWKLVAELNSLSTETDDKGAPLAKLSRGTTLKLPTQADIDEFRKRVTPAPNPADSGEDASAAAIILQAAGFVSPDNKDESAG